MLRTALKETQTTSTSLRAFTATTTFRFSALAFMQFTILTASCSTSFRLGCSSPATFFCTSRNAEKNSRGITYFKLAVKSSFVPVNAASPLERIVKQLEHNKLFLSTKPPLGDLSSRSSVQRLAFRNMSLITVPQAQQKFGQICYIHSSGQPHCDPGLEFSQPQQP